MAPLELIPSGPEWMAGAPGRYKQVAPPELGRLRSQDHGRFGSQHPMHPRLAASISSQTLPGLLLSWPPHDSLEPVMHLA